MKSFIEKIDPVGSHSIGFSFVYAAIRKQHGGNFPKDLFGQIYDIYNEFCRNPKLSIAKHAIQLTKNHLEVI